MITVRVTSRIAPRAGLVTAMAAMAAMAGAAAAAGRPAVIAAAAASARPAGRSPVSWPALRPRPAAVPPGHVVPLWRLPRGLRPGRYPGQRVTPDSIGEPGGYDPRELRAYLGLHGSGAGQTVAVTEAYNVRPSVTAALSGYDRWYGLRPACSATVTAGCFGLTFAAPGGTSSPISKIGNWIAEADLDVELVHALVPRAAIVVVEAHDDGDASMMAAVDYAQSLHPAAVSNSWGRGEFAGERALDGHCPAAGAICVFSSGDGGNYAACRTGGGTSCGGYPAASPGVLAVGGTTLDLIPSGKVADETAWPGSGGGISRYEPFPGYQRAADRWPSGRGIPDASFVADPNSGIATYQAFVFYYRGRLHDFGAAWAEIGGTSVGAPAWAAILASAGQLRAAADRPPLTVAGVHAALYAMARGKPVADITAGANGICGRRCSAGPGYDLVTGEGSPRPGIDTYLARTP